MTRAERAVRSNHLCPRLHFSEETSICSLYITGEMHLAHWSITPVYVDSSVHLYLRTFDTSTSNCSIHHKRSTNVSIRPQQETDVETRVRRDFVVHLHVIQVCVNAQRCAELHGIAAGERPMMNRLARSHGLNYAAICPQWHRRRAITAQRRLPRTACEAVRD